jgi:hypothetical protein
VTAVRPSVSKEVTIVKTWALGSLALGAALFGTALYIQTQPLAFTQIETTLEGSVEPVRGDESFDAAIVEPDTTLTPTATEAPAATAPTRLSERRSQPGPAAAPKTSDPLEPCSSWRELGPSHVVDGVGLDARRVRELC